MTLHTLPADATKPKHNDDDDNGNSNDDNVVIQAAYHSNTSSRVCHKILRDVSP